MANALQLGQYELNGDFVFGTRSPYAVPNSYLVGSFGEEQGEITNYDESLLLEDGTIFGEEQSGGMTISFDINIRNRKGLSVQGELGTIKKAWRPLNVRRQYGAVQTLRMNRFGPTRVVYGRGRNFIPEYGRVATGWCPITATFKCVDENYYDNDVHQETVGLSIPPSSGFFSPFTSPLTVSQYSEAAGVLDVEGDNPTWSLLKFNGPSINPTLEIDDWFKISLTVALDHTESIEIDPRPWLRGAFRNNGVSMTGRFSPDSTIWRDMLLEPGRHFAVYTAIDETLSSSVDVSWRPAWATP